MKKYPWFKLAPADNLDDLGRKHWSKAQWGVWIRLKMIAMAQSKQGGIPIHQIRSLEASEKTAELTEQQWREVLRFTFRKNGRYLVDQDLIRQISSDKEFSRVQRKKARKRWAKEKSLPEEQPGKSVDPARPPHPDMVYWQGAFIWKSDLKKILGDDESKLKQLHNRKPTDSALLNEHNRQCSTLQDRIIQAKGLLGFSAPLPPPPPRQISLPVNAPQDHTPELGELVRIVTTTKSRLDLEDMTPGQLRDRIEQAERVIQTIMDPPAEHRRAYYGDDGKMVPIISDKFERWKRELEQLRAALVLMENPKPQTRNAPRSRTAKARRSNAAAAHA